MFFFPSPVIFALIYYRMTASRVYIGRLSHRARDRDVEKLFKSFGRIREIVLKNGYGFVVGLCHNIVIVPVLYFFEAHRPRLSQLWNMVPDVEMLVLE